MVVVTLGVMEGMEEEFVEELVRHEVSLPAALPCEQNNSKSWGCVPMTEYDVVVTPPVLPFESIMASISTEPGPTMN